MFTPHFPEQLSINNNAYCKYLISYFENNLVYEQATKLDVFGADAIKYRARVIAKEPGVMAGIEEISLLLQHFESIVLNSNFKDGDFFVSGDELFWFDLELNGFSFKYERQILNLVSRLCGVATEVAKYVEGLSTFENKIGLLATRKVLLGPLDKKAFTIGGGLSHRLNQSQAVMIKKYHKIMYGLENLLRILSGSDLSSFEFVEFEVHSASEANYLLRELKTCNFEVPVGVMFDNFEAKHLSEILSEFKSKKLLNFDFVEASGGITLNNLAEYDMPFLDFVSVGSITKNSQAIDLSFDLEKR